MASEQKWKQLVDCEVDMRTELDSIRFVSKELSPNIPFFHVPITLVEQLQSEAYNKGKAETTSAMTGLMSPIIEKKCAEARAEERTRIINEACRLRDNTKSRAAWKIVADLVCSVCTASVSPPRSSEKTENVK